MNLRILAALALVAGCLRLDVFVFRPTPAADMDADLMADSEVPERLREEIWIDNGGTRVNAYVLRHDENDGTPAENHGRGIFYCHGNSTHIGTTVPRVDALWKLGFTVINFDPRGYGKTLGDQTEVGVFSDARAARDHFVGIMGGERNVGLYGRSLGSAVCLSVASTVETPALLLESPISSVQTIIDDSLSLDTPVDWFVDSRMDTPAMVARYSNALLIMHGLEDDYVQPKYGRQLLDLAGSPEAKKELWLVPGAHHGSVPCNAHGRTERVNDCEGGFSEEYLRRVRVFYEGALGRRE
jgi:pimeloyl-ACP methyl ester carboxylesterase